MNKPVVATAVVLLLASLTLALDFSISFVPPTEWENGDELLEQDLDFYSMYCNGAAEPFVILDSIIGTHSRVVDFAPLGEGTHVCHLTVTALNGEESGPSNTENFTVGPRTPGSPTNFVISL